jgi:hypothetical protein
MRNWAAFLLFDVLGLPLAALRSLFTGDGASVIAKAFGVWDGLRGRRIKDWLKPGEKFRRKKVEFTRESDPFPSP